MHALPVAQSGRLVEFERADVITPMIYPPQPTLVVSGLKPVPTMVVRLVPLVYIRQPEYWGIEVVGHVPPGPTPLSTNIPYAVELRLETTIGSVGVEVIGANRAERIPVAGEVGTEFVGAVEGGRFRPLYPSWTEDRRVRLTTAGVKDHGGPEAGELDLGPYEGSLLRVRGDYEDGWIHSATVVEQVRDSVLSIVARQVLGHRPD